MIYIIIAVIVGLPLTYHFLIRPRILRRGATVEESKRKFPGDEITPPKNSRSTMATTISAKPKEIWPWLVQVGWGKAAFYSYNKIEKLFGLDLHNADRIHPEWQNLKVGDTVWMGHPRMKFLFPETKVHSIDPNKSLVFAIYHPKGTQGKPSGAWSFVLEQIDENTTRLLVRLQLDTSDLLPRLVHYFFLEPAHCVMQKGVFNGLKTRLAQFKE